MNVRTLLFLSLAAATLPTQAQSVYRSIDSEGNVTFSETPVPGAVQQTQIPIDAPQPSAASHSSSSLR